MSFYRCLPSKLGSEGRDTHSWERNPRFFKLLHDGLGARRRPILYRRGDSDQDGAEVQARGVEVVVGEKSEGEARRGLWCHVASKHPGAHLRGRYSQ